MANLDLFNVAPAQETVPVAARLGEAERLLQDLADYIYGHTSLKPMSKTLFVVSRCLLVGQDRPDDTLSGVAQAYGRRIDALRSAAPSDDFDFATTLEECGSHLAHLLETVDHVKALCADSDSLGLAFNALLRGKWEGGEGLGTHLTPEEVVRSMVAIAFESLPCDLLDQTGSSRASQLFGDPCGGTGRFVVAIAHELSKAGYGTDMISQVTRLYDQSSLSVDFAKLNFAFNGLKPEFRRVHDSLTSPELSNERGRYAIIATNPPFGSGKYAWSTALEDTLGRGILASIGMERAGDTSDPAELFFFRCLDLLAVGGILAVVLPDGVVTGLKFRRSLDAYERLNDDCVLELLAFVSLPAATFSLGGTVARTSFLVVRKTQEDGQSPLYVAKANHVGFLKRGKHRVPDPGGNDLVRIVREYGLGPPASESWVRSWREYDRLMPSMGQASGLPKGEGTALTSMVRLKNDRGRQCEGTRCWYHVSILDVDETGAIDVAGAKANRPATPPLACRGGDVLVSCLNPRIWRVAVVPDLDGDWTCSSEFAVLRPNAGVDGWELSIRLQHRDVIDAACALASGTSSSRQRVNKRALLEGVFVPAIQIDADVLARHRLDRENHYRCRLSEHEAFGKLRGGERRFAPA